MSYLLILFLVGSFIFIHEMGHYLAARIVKIPIKRLSVGFGPKIASIRKGKTEFWLSAIPLGGYVVPEMETSEDFYKFSAKQRAIFSLGGPLANVIAAFALFAVLNLFSAGLSFYGLFVQPFTQMADAIGRLFSMIPLIISHPEQLSGIFGIVAVGGQSVGFDLEKIISFSVLLSLNFAIFNLIPMLPLDGGKILLCALEKLSPRVAKLQLPLALTGWALLLGFFLYLTVQDIDRLTR